MATLQYSEEDCVRFFQSMFRINVSKEFMAKPDYEMTAVLLERFLQDFGIDNYYQPDLVATLGINNLERFEELIPKVNLWKAIAFILGNGSEGTMEFTFSDLLSPKRRKNYRVFVRLMTIWTQHANLKKEWDDTEKKYCDLPQRKEEIEDRIKHLRRLHEEKTVFLSQNRAQSQQMSDKMKKCVDRFEEKKKKGNALQEESRVLKQATFLKKEAIAAMARSTGEMKEKVAQLEEKIVRSPGKIQANTDAKGRVLEEKRAERRRLEKEFMEVSRQLETTRKAVKEMEPSLGSIKVTFEGIESLRTECEQLEDLKAQQQAKGMKREQLARVAKKHEDTVASLRQQLGKIQSQHQYNMRPLLEMNQGISRQLEEKKAAGNKSKKEQQMIDEERGLRKQLEDIRIKRESAKESLENFFSKNSAATAAFGQLFRDAIQGLADNSK